MSDEQNTGTIGENGVDDGQGGRAGSGGEGRQGQEDEGQTSLEAVVAERDELKDRMLRIAADFENWKKRSRKEQTDAELRARESVLKDMLEVMDNLERAVGSSGAPAAAATPADAGPILKGVSLVLRLFQSKLERYEVRAVEAKGQPFDPRLHEAISRVETADVAPGTVVTELQRGYRIGDRLLRPAMVSVAAAPSGGGSANSREGGTA